MIIYLAGGITKVKNYIEKFMEADAAVTDMTGADIINPAARPQGLTNAEYMDISYADIKEADAVVFIRGWRKSKGAKLEHKHCKYIGKQTMYLKRTCRGWKLDLPKKKYKRGRKRGI